MRRAISSLTAPRRVLACRGLLTVTPIALQAADNDSPRYTKPTEAPEFLTVTVEGDKGISHLQLNCGPVNSLSYEMLLELNQWLLWLGSNEETAALVISSALPTVFCAGLDISEMHKPEEERLVNFLNAFQEMWLIMNSFPKPIVAALNGHSPAGGCIIGLACDYRVMTRGPPGDTDGRRAFRIGLNETKLGITAPAWTMPAYSYVLGDRRAELMLLMGATSTADEALKIGLVDEVTADTESCIAAAFKQTGEFLAIPNDARRMSRDMMRRGYLHALGTLEARQYDTEFTSSLIMTPEIQKTLGAYMESMRNRKK